MSLDCGWKQQYQEETHAGKRAYHCATMLSIFMTKTNDITISHILRRMLMLSLAKLCCTQLVGQVWL